jgi:non-specific serine/threonine protein kinase
MKALAGNTFLADETGFDGTSFVGRRRESAELKSMLSESRLVTLTGVGGVGKTRLALHVAEKVQRAFADGVRWVPLADVSDPDLLELTVMQSVGPRTSSTAALTDYLHDRHVLLVLDNCEHLVDSCAQLVTWLLPRCPGVRILATSREVLNVEGERTFMVAPLPVFHAGEGAPNGSGRTDAVALFAERAAAAVPGFEVTADNVQAVAALCSQLDGLPLAIELAAVRLAGLSVDDLLAPQDERYDLLAADHEAQTSRHRSLRAAVDWSFDLCSPEERLLWARLSVFSGGCDLEAAENVCSDQELSRGAVLEAMSGLVEKSVVLRESTASRARYRMLDTIHQYGRLRLRSGDEEQCRLRHRDHYRKLANRVEEQWFGAGQVELFASVREEHANLRAALEYCMADPGQTRAGLHMAAALTIYWMACGLPQEGLHWLERALTARDPSRERAMALWAAALLNASSENPSPEAAADILAKTEECRRLAEALEDRALLAHATWLSGFGQLFGDDPVQGFAMLQEGIAAERAIDTPSNSYLALALHHLTLAAALAGMSDLGNDTGEECLSLCRAGGDQWLRSWTIVFLGTADWQEGRRESTVRRLREAIDLKRPFNDWLGIGCAIEFLAWSEITDGDSATGARLLGAATVFLKRMGLDFDNIPAHGIAVGDRDHRTLARQARKVLGEAAYIRAHQSGTRLSQEQALAFALGKEPGQSAAAAGATEPKVLTRREEQIAEMLSEGLSNREIAERLVIAQRTVESHVASILTKLGYTSRSQVAVWFIQRQRETVHRQNSSKLPG